MLIFYSRTIQRKQKEIKELKATLEKLGRENERLGKKLEAAWLEGSLGAKVVKAEVVKEDKERKPEDKTEHREGQREQPEDRRREQDENIDQQPSKTDDDEMFLMNERLDTNRSEGERWKLIS